MLLLLLGNPFCDDINSLSTLQGFQQIFRSLFIFMNEFLKLLCITVAAFPFTEVHHFFGNHIDIIGGQKIPQLVNYQIFNVFFADRLFVAGLIPAVGHTLVVMVFSLCLAGAADTCHSGFTMSAEQFCSKQIVHFSLRSCGGFFIFLHDTLCLPKQIFIHNAGETIGNFIATVGVCANIPFVPQNTIDTVFVKLIPIGCFDLVGIEIADNIGHCGASHIHLKDFNNDWSGKGIDHNLLVFGLEAQCNVATCGKALFSVNVHAPLNLLGQLYTVIFGHSLQNGFHQNTTGIV